MMFLVLVLRDRLVLSFLGKVLPSGLQVQLARMLGADPETGKQLFQVLAATGCTRRNVPGAHEPFELVSALPASEIV